MSFQAPVFQMADMAVPEVQAAAADSHDHSSPEHMTALVVVLEDYQDRSTQEQMMVLVAALEDLVAAAEAAALNPTLNDRLVQMMMVATSHQEEVSYHYHQDLDHHHPAVAEAVPEVEEVVPGRHSVARSSADHCPVVLHPIQSLRCHPS